MEIVSPERQVPLFHCVDRDWCMEGFKFQFAPGLEEEAETAINTMLPLLQHMFPKIDVASYFEADAEVRCQHMEWSIEKQMIVDTVSPDETECITEEETLVGFVVDFSNEKPSTLKRPIQQDIPTFSPHGDDSVSTLRPSDRTTLTTANPGVTSQRFLLQPTPPPISNQSDSSISSRHANITVESFLNLESKVAGLTTQLLTQQNNHAHQFNSIMQSVVYPSTRN